jgi:hypothetical protein
MTTVSRQLEMPNATASTPGAMSAADKAKSDSLATGGWLDSVALSIPTIAPGVAGPLRHYTWLRPSDLITGLSASSTYGNGTVIVASSSLVSFGNMAVPAFGGSPWMFACQAKIPAPATAKDCAFGLDGGGYQILVGNNYALGGNATTQLFIQVYAGGAEAERVFLGVSDPLAFHTYAVGWDGARLRVGVDGVVISTFVPAPATFPSSYGGNPVLRCTSGFGLAVSDYAYAL